MNGATALDCENTINRPNSTNTMTIGSSQYFFSWRRNWMNSDSTRLFAMTSFLCAFCAFCGLCLLWPASIHPREMILVAIARRIRRPAGPMLSLDRERVASDQPPDERHGRQDDEERDRQDHPGVDVAEDQRELPPHRARVLQQARRGQAEHHEHGADAGEDRRGGDPPAPPEHGRQQQQKAADGHAERSFLEVGTLMLLHH